ncbi:MAG TPA: hypothetical protein VFR24_20085 [Candidatus Angelobacter sp.]|nr:hypothetical protein [Candidatus Angelobacter sp.]
MPIVPPVTLPALPAVLGVPCVTEGVPIVLVPGEVVVVEVDGVVCVLVVPGVVVVVLGDVGLVVCVLGLVVCPIPVLGVAVPVVCAEATPTASANTADANKTFRIEHAPLSRIAAARFSPRGICVLFLIRCTAPCGRWHEAGLRTA